MKPLKSGAVIRACIYAHWQTPDGFIIEQLDIDFQRNGRKVVQAMVTAGELFKVAFGHKNLMCYFQSAALAADYKARTAKARTTAAIACTPSIAHLAPQPKARPPAAKAEPVYTAATIYTFGRAYVHSAVKPLFFQHGGQRARVC